jgi:hypothetical protein
MKTLAQLASALIAASALLCPLSAMAETKAPVGHHHRESAHHDSAFPMKADTFKRLVEGKLQGLKGHLDKQLAKRSLSHQQKAEIDKSMDSGMKDVHAAMEKASADGVVTKDEAKHVKAVSEALRDKVRGELKGKHASAKAKGAKPSKAGKKAPSKKHEKPSKG